ncbi:hypothetical protein TRVL_07941 [Trypanosoma vivax]|nr:hypothetical protein TRVL_07941 [Trypanosoma vivax]
MELKAAASAEWGPDTEKIRALFLAPVQAEMCYGVASWGFDTLLSVRERLERSNARASHIVEAIPKLANREDALRVARPKAINEVAHRRAMEYFLRLKAKGPEHAKVLDSIFRPERPIHIRLAKVQHLHSTIDKRESCMMRWGRSWLGVSTSKPPRRSS